MKNLDQVIENSGFIDIGTSLKDGWKYVSEKIGYYILGGLLIVFVSMIASLIPILGGIVNSLILSPAFIAGGIYVTWNISKKQGWNKFEEMFNGFKNLSPLIICSLISIIAMLFLGLIFLAGLIPEIIKLVQLSKGMGAINNQSEIKDLVFSFINTKNLLLFLGLFLGSIFISIIWVFKYHFVVVYNAQSWPAMEASRKVAMKNFFPILVTLFIMGILIILSAIPLGLGLLVTLPWAIGVTYSMFEQATHCNEDAHNELNEIGKELEY